jgi:hypothetical protein
MGKLKRLIPYWLRSSEHTCERCGGGYAYAVERRCYDCDSALCPFCITVVETSGYCEPCSPAGKRRKR